MRKLLLVLSLIMAVSVPAFAFAATTATTAQPSQATQECPYGFSGNGGFAANLTDEQKQELEEAFGAMLDVKRDIIQEMVADGTITEEQGDLMLERLDSMEQFHEENGYPMMGRRMMNGDANGIGNGPGNGLGRGAGNGMMMQNIQK